MSGAKWEKATAERKRHIVKMEAQVADTANNTEVEEPLAARSSS